MIYFIQSNRLEHLFDRLCSILDNTRDNPLQAREIVVQNPGMGRWVFQQMALHTGIAANLRFPLPGRFIWQVLADQLDLPPDEGMYERQVMLWRIADELTRALDEPDFFEVKNYLHDDQDGRKAFHLAARIADLFDQYLIYRPNMLLDWEEAGTEIKPQFAWQAILWKRLARSAGQHRARHFARFFAKCEAGELNRSVLPETICLFGISSLAPVYLQVITALEPSTHVYVFHVNPCRRFWEDIVSTAERARRRKGSGILPEAGAETYYFGGNPLLATQGKLGREFIRRLCELGLNVDDDRFFMEPEGDFMLATLQRDILDLVDRSEPGAEKSEAVEHDRSVQFHSCHSRVREVQVLHDRLLDLFDADPQLKPGDILIMAPDIERYASSVRSVFNGAEGGMFIPWSLADRVLSAEHPLAASFLSLFELCTGRCGAPDVMSFLETGAVRRRFRLEEEDLVSLREWIGSSGIRWGLDRDHRREFGCGLTSEHSWSFGIGRLLMGYLTGVDPGLVHSISPCRDLSSAEGVLLGRLVAFLEQVGTTRTMITGSHGPAQWAALLLELLDAYYDPGTSEEEQQGLYALRETIFTLRDASRLADFGGKVSFPVVRDWLREALAAPGGGHGFLSGRVTFCNMVPMRSVPFSVICLLGMNDTDYPRQQIRAGFDLIGKEPRLGDRNRMDDDRYLFLEALISARKVFSVSWLGHDQLDNSPRSPSVVVADLIDYVRRGFSPPLGAPREWPVIEHPLQPFSPKCFSSKADVRSYAGQWLPVSSATGEHVFIKQPLIPPPDEWRTVDLGRLMRFWSHPVQFFLQHRLEMPLPEEEDILEENEPFESDGLARYHLKNSILEASLLGRDMEEVFQLLQADGLLPHANFGRNVYQELRIDIEEMLAEVKPLLRDPEEPLELDLTVGPFRITGRLGGLFAEGCIRYRPAKLKGKDLVRLWLEHLVFNGLGKKGRSVFVAQGETVVLHPVEDAPAQLRDLLELYWQGLSAPLHFYPETSWAWFKAAEVKKHGKALEKWRGRFGTNGEGEDVAYRTALAGVDPLDRDFQILAGNVYGPIHACICMDSEG